MDKYERRRLRLVEARDLLFDGSIAAMARRVDKAESYVGRMMWPEGRAGRKRIGEDMVEHLETALALPRGTLDSDAPVSEALTHKRGARVNKLSQKETFVANISTGSLRAGNPKGSLRAAHAVPVLTWEQALDPNAMHAETYLPAPITASEGAFYLQVEGPSMQAPAEPTFSEGDLILVEPESDSRAGALVVVSLPDTPLPVFRQLVVEGQRRYLRALNPAWPEPISPLPTDALIIGVVHNKVVRY